ncbi:hypothetical protein U0070_015097 [Myodes glareolus]|uniref:ABC transmembrane type-1 domain-containing protein n=1 Tax=Myodes glareolus TaxID=447135 RepID=A0AAW0JY05_MYOGA
METLHEKVTILVTHQLQYLKAASHILILKDTENTQAAQPEESRLEGKIGLKAYKNYFAAGLTAITVLFGIARSLLVFYVLVKASQTLHNRMFESILRAPVLFFDRNPIATAACEENEISGWFFEAMGYLVEH